MKKSIACFLVCAIIVSFASVGCQNNGTKKYTWSIEMLNTTGKTAEETKNDYEANWDSLFEKIVVNYDGTITFFCTEEQRVRWVENRNNLISSLYQTADRNGMQLWISEDRREYEVTVNPNDDNALALNLIYLLTALNGQCYLYQLFSDIPNKDIVVSFSIINAKNGNVVASDIFPGGAGVSIYPDDWN